MIHIAERPQQISFSKNPIVFKVQNESNGELIVSSGAKSVFTISLLGSGGPTTPYIFQDNQVLTLTLISPSLREISQSFTFKNSPGPGEIAVDAALIDIFNTIKKHHILAPHVNFKAIDDTDQFKFVAECIYFEADWDLSWSISPNVQGFVIEDSPLSIVPDLEIAYTLFFEKRYDGGEWKFVFNGSILIPSFQGFAYCNVMNILESECLLSIPENPFAHYSHTNSVVSNNVRRYYSNFFSGPDDVTDDIRYVMIGGTPNRIWLSNQLLQNMGLNNSFLTYQPNFQRIPFNGVQYLTWFNYTGEAQAVCLYVTPYEIITAGFEYIPVQSNVTVPAGLCVTFPIHPEALAIDGSKTHYDFQVKSQTTGSNLSEKRTIIVENDTNKPFRYLAFLNAFGVPEVAICTGNLTTKISITAETWTSIRNIQAGVSILRNERLVAKIDKKYTYRSGYLTQSQKEAYSEVAISYRIADVTTPQYYQLSVIESKSDEVINDDGEKLYTWEWQMQPVLAESSFAPDFLVRTFPANAEPPAFPLGIGSDTGITTGLKSYYLTKAEFEALKNAEQLQEGIYFITDTNPNEVWFSGGGNAAVEITYGPLRYVKIDNVTGTSLTLSGITATNAEARKRMRFYRGNVEIFLDLDITILSNDELEFILAFDNETFRAFY